MTTQLGLVLLLPGLTVQARFRVVGHQHFLCSPQLVMVYTEHAHYQTAAVNMPRDLDVHRMSNCRRRL